MVRVREKSDHSRRRRARGSAALAALWLLFSAVPAAAADDPLLSRLVGDWIGRGTSRTSATAKPEMVYCKVSNRLIEDGAVLQQKGRCAVASNSGAIKGLISARGDGRYDGSLDSMSTSGPATLAGKGGHGRIEFNAAFVSRQTHRPSRANISLILSGDGKYRLTSNALAADDKTRFIASDILFARQ